MKNYLHLYMKFVKIFLNEGVIFITSSLFFSRRQNMNNELANIGYEYMKDLIYTIRGKQVMLDSYVAKLYEYQTKNINKAVGFLFSINRKRI